MRIDEDIEVSNKYLVFYKYNEVVFGEVFRRFKTNFTHYEGVCRYGFPAYDTVEEANEELIRYNSCKQEVCG